MLLLVVFLAALLAYARWVEPARLVVRRVDVPVEGLPESLAGYRILAASDLHSAWFGPAQSRVAKTVDRLARQDPGGKAFDAAVFAGDLIDVHRPDPEPGRALLALLAVRAPVYFAAGNHDEVHLDEVLAAVREAGAVVLGPEPAAEPAQTGPSVAYVGDSHWRPRPEELAARVRAARSRAGAGRKPPFVVVVVHSPAPGLAVAAREAGAGLVVAGHDHGGQVALPLVGPLWTPTRGWLPGRSAGLFDVDGIPQFVSAGLGTSTFPVRFLVPPSLAVLRLVPAPSAGAPSPAP